MKRIFVRSLVISAVVQFAVTRHRAGQTVGEGAAEMMWLRYPASVLLNALAWTVMLSLLGGTIGALRRLR